MMLQQNAGHEKLYAGVMFIFFGLETRQM